MSLPRKPATASELSDSGDLDDLFQKTTITESSAREASKIAGLPVTEISTTSPLDTEATKDTILAQLPESIRDYLSSPTGEFNAPWNWLDEHCLNLAENCNEIKLINLGFQALVGGAPLLAANCVEKALLFMVYNIGDQIWRDYFITNMRNNSSGFDRQNEEVFGLLKQQVEWGVTDLSKRLPDDELQRIAEIQMSQIMTDKPFYDIFERCDNGKIKGPEAAKEVEVLLRRLVNSRLCQTSLPTQLEHLCIAIPVCTRSREQTTMRFIKLRCEHFADFQTILRGLKELQREAEYTLEQLKTAGWVSFGPTPPTTGLRSDGWRVTTASAQPRSDVVRPSRPKGDVKSPSNALRAGLDEEDIVES